MKIEQQTLGTVDVLTPVGPLVDEDGAAFSKRLTDQVTGPNPRVVVSLQEVPYMDSAAIEGILDAADKLADRALPLKLVEVQATCRQVFELTGVSGRFSFFDSVQDAVRSFL